jgi:hypothetical protein
MGKITHKTLCNLGTDLEHTSIEAGICRGFSGQLILSLLAKDAVSFFKRLKLIEKYFPSDEKKERNRNFNQFNDKINEIKEAAKDPDHVLSEDDREL